MSKFDTRKIMPRYLAIAVVMTVVGIAIVGRALYLMTAKKEYWTEVASRLKHDSIPMKPTRGNILSSDGQLMATSIPEYRIYMDFQPGALADTAWKNKYDSIWRVDMDSICRGLNHLFPKQSAEEFRKCIEEGMKAQTRTGVGSRHWPLWRSRIDYNTFKEVRQLSMLCFPANKGGFHWEEFNARRRPFGSLAKRTVGDLFGAKDSARFGLEMSFDSILRGNIGIMRRQKVLNKRLDLVVKPAEAGSDIVTTIDVNMQDLAERAVIDELREINGKTGVAIVMEVKTGDVKAIVNMTRMDDGQYAEAINSAVSFRCEPGSVFKVASFLVALDDGVVDTSYVIHTGCGIMPMHGREMKDHNWRRGGYQDINVARALEVSSNVGVSYVIDHFYGSNPKRYVEGLYRVGINEDLELPIVGYHPPKISMPNTKTSNKAEYWSRTTLPWMSIGYETQIAPINTLAFYNAIANNGKMMRPRFVKQIVKDGEVVRELEPEVIKQQIARPEAIRTMQTILEHVVSQGLGKKAGSKMFKVAGKTGTAQMSKGRAGYRSGVVDYWLSFAGYFPADNPKYSCIVCLEKSGLPASGGGMSGVVFHRIAEGVMSKHLKMHVNDAKDENSIAIPDVKDGDVKAAGYVLSQLGVNSNSNWDGSYAYGNPVWGKAIRLDKGVQLTQVAQNSDVVPNVIGMGARDAVYMMERSGVKVQLSGCGKVKEQSLAAGKPVAKGMICSLRLGL